MEVVASVKREERVGKRHNPEQLCIILTIFIAWLLVHLPSRTLVSTAVNTGQQNIMKTYSRAQHELRRKVTVKRLDIKDFPVTDRVT